MDLRCSSCRKLNRVGALADGKRALCGNCKTPLAAGEAPVVVTDANFDALMQEEKPIVVDFWAPWCGPCRVVGPIVEALAAERSDVRFGKLNVDENPRTAGRFAVSSIPTLIFFRAGSERDRLTGAAGKPHLTRWIDQQLRS